MDEEEVHRQSLRPQSLHQKSHLLPRLLLRTADGEKQEVFGQMMNHLSWVVDHEGGQQPSNSLISSNPSSFSFRLSASLAFALVLRVLVQRALQAQGLWVLVLWVPGLPVVV